MRLKSRNCVLIDALDELQTAARRPLISRLVDLQQDTGVNLFVTSRNITGDQNHYSSNRPRPSAVFINTHGKLAAMRAQEPYPAGRHQGCNHSGCWGNVRADSLFSPCQQVISNRFLTTILSRFLLADLHLRSLRNVRPSQKAVRNALKALTTGPSAATDAFENALKRIIGQQGNTSRMAMRTLLLLTYARRLLTVDELCHAIAVEVDEEDGELDEDNVPEIEDVLPSCAGLVVVQSRHGPAADAASTLYPRSCVPSGPQNGSSSSSYGHILDDMKNNVVQLIHKSFQDYLSLTKSQLFPRAESIMDTICRAYISACEGAESATDRHFLYYAETRWGYHHLKAEADTAATEMDSDLNLSVRRKDPLPIEKKNLSAGVEFGVRQLSKELGGSQELLFWACKESRLNLVEVLLTTNFDIYNRQLEDDSDDSDSDEVCEYQVVYVVSLYSQSHVLTFDQSWFQNKAQAPD